MRNLLNTLPAHDASELCAWVADAGGVQAAPADSQTLIDGGAGPWELQVCPRNEAADKKYAEALEAAGFRQDPDVLDTWFSSALWPFSTLGWPDPANAPIGEDQTLLGPDTGREDAFSYYYPGSCLVTARDIITLWVARMVIMGLYNHGSVPFTDCFVHAKILDGRGVTMSKSKGNGIDPVDIIDRYGADAMRYLICDMETGMQDVRLPVQAQCPACNVLVELTDASHGSTIFTYLCTSCGAEFDVLGTMKDIPAATVISDRFDIGRNFCNKLYNATRFALMNLQDTAFSPLTPEQLAPRPLDSLPFVQSRGRGLGASGNVPAFLGVEHSPRVLLGRILRLVPGVHQAANAVPRPGARGPAGAGHHPGPDPPPSAPLSSFYH